jgi:hypothetical protein
VKDTTRTLIATMRASATAAGASDDLADYGAHISRALAAADQLATLVESGDL